MQKALDLALLLGILMILTKGADLLLLERQKVALDRGFRRFYSFLTDLNPATWLTFLRNDVAKIIVVATIGLVILALGIKAFWFDILEAWNHGREDEIFITCGLLIISVRVTTYIAKLLGTEIWAGMPGWLLEANSVHAFALRYVLIASCLTVFLISLVPIATSPSDLVLLVAYLPIVLCTPLLIYTWALLLVLLPFFCVSVVLVAVATVVGLIRGTCERILEYSKGVYAGLVLLLTLLFGLIELWMRHK